MRIGWLTTKEVNPSGTAPRVRCRSHLDEVCALGSSRHQVLAAGSQGMRSGPSDLTGTRSEPLDPTELRSRGTRDLEQGEVRTVGSPEGRSNGWIRHGIEVREGDNARRRSGPWIHDEGRSGPSDPDNGRLGREGFRREEGIDGADPQKGDLTKIKGPGGQDRPEGGPDGQG